MDEPREIILRLQVLPSERWPCWDRRLKWLLKSLLRYWCLRCVGREEIPKGEVMAWNPSPEVAAARDFGKKFGADRVIIVYTTELGQLGWVSYGKTKRLCDATKPLAEAAYDAVYRKLEEGT